MLKIQLKKPVKFAFGQPAVSEVTVTSLIIQQTTKSVTKEVDGEKVQINKKVYTMNWQLTTGSLPHGAGCSAELTEEQVKPLLDVVNSVSQQKIEDESI